MPNKKNKYNNARNVSAELQRYVQKFENDIYFTQGAAEVLATRAAEEIVSKNPRVKYEEALALAMKEFGKVIKKLEKEPSLKNGHINKSGIQALKRDKKFCGVSPWC